MSEGYTAYYGDSESREQGLRRAIHTVNRDDFDHYMYIIEGVDEGLMGCEWQGTEGRNKPFYLQNHVAVHLDEDNMPVFERHVEIAHRGGAQDLSDGDGGDDEREMGELDRINETLGRAGFPFRGGGGSWGGGGGGGGGRSTGGGSSRRGGGGGRRNRGGGHGYGGGGGNRGRRGGELEVHLQIEILKTYSHLSHHFLQEFQALWAAVHMGTTTTCHLMTMNELPVRRQKSENGMLELK